MRLLLVVYDAMDPGGITNSGEQYAAGLIDLGHHVELAGIFPQSKIGAVRDINRGSDSVFRGVTYDQRYGWFLPKTMRWAAGNIDAIKIWQKFGNTFDGIIWDIPVPPVNNNWKYNGIWPELYRLRPPQMVITHDHNLHKGYPHLAVVAHRMKGVATTHPCSYNDAAVLGLPRVLLGSPNDTRQIPKTAPWEKRDKRWASVQTFKRLKRIDELCRAQPLMKYGGTLMGGGIEQYYLTSKDKIRPQYIYSEGKYKGKRIWDVALKHGMDYKGWVTNAERDVVLGNSRVLIDSSWRKQIAAQGAQFNRVALEGIRMGCLPIVRTRGTVVSVDDKSDFFQHGTNCIAIPWDATAGQFAAIVDDTIEMPEAAAEKMIKNGMKLLKAMDRKYAANAILSILFGEPVGVMGWQDKGTGVMDKAFKDEGAKLHKNHFLVEA